MTNFFKNPLVEGKYNVIPPPSIPSHIALPKYVTDPNPKFGEYEEPSKPHTPEAIESMLSIITQN